MSKSLRSRIRQAVLLGCVSGAALLVLVVGQASAATYPGGGSTFTGSAEGWKVASSECKVAGLLELCNNNGSGYDASEGAPAGSFADKSQILLNALGLFRSNVVAESPTFTAVGSGAGSLSLSRAFAPGGIALTPSFTYTANLVDKTTNTKQKVITESFTAKTTFASKSGSVSLVAGHNYAVQIEAEASASVLGVATETAGYFDNVVVTGPDASGVPGSNGGANGGAGGNGAAAGGEEGAGAGRGKGGSGGGVSSARLESLIRSSSLVGSATLKGNRLSVKAKCPAKVGATCTLKLQGMLSGKKPATAARRARVEKGKVKNFTLVVKPAARKVVRTRTKLLFKESVRVGKAKATVYKSLKLIRK